MENLPYRKEQYLEIHGMEGDDARLKTAGSASRC
jgi:hypothetical protein